jgi:CheY-like chemotaxis protein
MIARKMGQDPDLRQIPVLIITSIREQIAFLFGSQALHPHFVEVDELLEKPVDPRLLLERIEALLKAAAAAKKTGAKAPPAK